MTNSELTHYKLNYNCMKNISKLPPQCGLKDDCTKIDNTTRQRLQHTFQQQRSS